MFANLTNGLDFQAKALLIRAERQRVIASNIANVDTPGYVGRDINFKEAMNTALGTSSTLSLQMAQPNSGTAATASSTLNTYGATDPRHIPLQSQLGTLSNNGAPNLAYTPVTEPAMDGNSVDIDRERASFVDNSVRYESTLRFINGTSKTILSAIQGQ
jgi:flagellar basal-body rod protein FlgB